MTFGVRGRGGAGKHHVQGLLVFFLALGLTAGALALLPTGVSHGVEVAAVVAANLAATVLKFVLFRSVVFRSRTA